MRVLFTTVPGSGHLHPLVPLAQALRARDHEVAFATAPRFCKAVERSGFRALAAGRDWLGSEATPGAEPLDSLRRFVAVGGDMVRDLLARADQFRPDLLVREQAELGDGPRRSCSGFRASCMGSTCRGRPASSAQPGRRSTTSGLAMGCRPMQT